METEADISRTTNKDKVERLPSPDSAIGSPEMSSPVDDTGTSIAAVAGSLVPVDQEPLIEHEEKVELTENSDDEEASLSESEIVEMVVTGSMQFALTRSASTNIHSSNSDTGAISDATVVDQVTHNEENNTVKDAAAKPATTTATTSDTSPSSAPEAENITSAPSPSVQKVSSDALAADSSTDNNSKGSNGTDVEDSDPSTPRVRIKRLKRRHRQGVLGLPTTVVQLEGPGACEVYVVGTAHFSKESQQDVTTTIERVRPDVLVLELCRARTAILSLDEETILHESKTMNFSKMKVVLQQHGRVQGMLYLLLLSVSAHITKQLGMAPGGEFRAAVAAARRVVPLCSVQLGDRPINVTLGRALSALSPWSKLKLAFHIITTTEPISKEDVEKCKDKDMIEELLAEMTGQFPAISEVFVTERDKFLSNSLYVACTPHQHSGGRGRAPRRVVGVVGIGHLKGVQEHWGKLHNKDIMKLLIIPPPSLSNRVVSVLCRVGVWSVAGYACYRLLLPAATKESISATLGKAAATITDLSAKFTNSA